MNFHSRCIAVMRAAAEAAACLSPYVPASTGEISIRGNGIDIADGDATPRITDGTNFGFAGVDGDSVTRVFTLFNTGTGPLLISSASVSGIGVADFTITDSSIGVLDPGASSSLQVRFDPTAPTTRTATLVVASDDTNEASYEMAIRGTGLTGSGPRTYSYSGAPVSIPDATFTSTTIPITVAGFTGSLADLNFRFDGSTCSPAAGAEGVGVSHSYVGDLAFELQSPAGTRVPLITRRGGTGNNFCQLTFDDEAGEASISTITPDGAPPPGPPFTGVFTPESPLTAFKGENPNGTWLLRVADVAAEDTGAVRGFTLVLSNSVGSIVGPDLVPSWGTGSSEAVSEALKVSGTTANFSLTGTCHVYNVGTGSSAAASALKIYVSPDATFSADDVLLYTKTVGSIKPTASGKLPKAKKVKVKLLLSASVAGKYLLAVLDSPNDIGPGNNSAAGGPVTRK